MSKNEIYNLLEIHAPEHDLGSVHPTQNALKHLLIRVFSIIFIIGGILLFSEIQNLGMNDGLAVLLGCAILFIIWFIFIVIEAIVLQVRKKPVLRNVNLIIIGFTIVCIMLFLGTIR